MSEFTTPLDVRHLDGKNWMVLAPFSYYVGDTPNERSLITVPEKFKTDFASIPRIFHAIMRPAGKHGKAAVLHDWLYRCQLDHGYDRAAADAIFKQAMQVLGVGVIKRNIMYASVRAWGCVTWRKHQVKLGIRETFWRSGE